MTSRFSVTVAADELDLLTLPELRVAVGDSDADDGDLLRLGAMVAAGLAAECRIREAPPTPATFRLETLTEVFRLTGCPKLLRLSRRPVIGVDSVTIDGTALTSDDHEVNAASGMLSRLSDDTEVLWSGRKITVVYRAGWSVVPDTLKQAATKYAKLVWLSDGPDARDPLLKRERNEGVNEFEYWIPSPNDPSALSKVRELLGNYMEDVWA